MKVVGLTLFVLSLSGITKTYSTPLYNVYCMYTQLEGRTVFKQTARKLDRNKAQMLRNVATKKQGIQIIK